MRRRRVLLSTNRANRARGREALVFRRNPRGGDGRLLQNFVGCPAAVLHAV